MRLLAIRTYAHSDWLMEHEREGEEEITMNPEP